MTDDPDRKGATPTTTDTPKSVRVRQALLLLAGALALELLDPAGAYPVGVGLGAVAGTLLARRHFDVSPLGLGATAAAAGLINLALKATPSTAT